MNYNDESEGKLPFKACFASFHVQSLHTVGTDMRKGADAWTLFAEILMIAEILDVICCILLSKIVANACGLQCA